VELAAADDTKEGGGHKYLLQRLDHSWVE
jgi:hypothetical protein